MSLTNTERAMMWGPPKGGRVENEELGPFVEGLVMGLIDMQRIGNMPGGWKCEAMVPDPTGTHALYFVSPSGIRWRIRAEIEDEADAARVTPTVDALSAIPKQQQAVKDDPRA